MPDPSTRHLLASTESTFSHTDEAEGDAKKSGKTKSKSEVLADAYSELSQLQERGVYPSLTEFSERYPSYRTAVRNLVDVEDEFVEHDGVTSTWPKVGDEYRGFQLVDILGGGASAQVYLAEECAVGDRLVAIKVAYEGKVEAFTLGKLSHENIVKVHSVRSDKNSKLTAVCMPYLGSATLWDVLDELYASRQPLERGSQILAASAAREHVKGFCDQFLKESPPSKAFTEGSYVDAVVEIGIQLAQALAHMSESGFLHRDLKPANVLMTPNGQPMLLDFCLSTKWSESTRRHGGTLPYTSPEQIQIAFLKSSGGATLDPRSDLFSLGVMLYECLTGRLPFGNPAGAADMKEVACDFIETQRAPFKPITDWNPAVDRRLANTIHRCLAFDPEDRIESPAALARQLGQHFSRRARAWRWIGQHRLTVAALCLAGMLGVASIGGYYFTRPSEAERLKNHAVTAVEQQQHADAVEYLTQLLLLEPDSVWARYGRGLALLELKDYSAAITDFHQVATAHPTSMTRELQAYACVGGGDGVAAATYYKMAASLADGDERARLLVNQAHQLVLKSNRYAGNAISQAIELKPQFAAPYHLRARLILRREFVELTSLDQAIADIRRALEFPGHWLLYLEAAHLFAMAAESGESSREPEVEQLLKMAAEAGLPEKRLGQPWLESWRDRPWYDEVVELCRSTDPRPLTQFQTAPDMELAHELFVDRTL